MYTSLVLVVGTVSHTHQQHQVMAIHPHVTPWLYMAELQSKHVACNAPRPRMLHRGPAPSLRPYLLERSPLSCISIREALLHVDVVRLVHAVAAAHAVAAHAVATTHAVPTVA